MAEGYQGNCIGKVQKGKELHSPLPGLGSSGFEFEHGV